MAMELPPIPGPNLKQTAAVAKQAICCHNTKATASLVLYPEKVCPRNRVFGIP
jgi:hypothetical protein